MVFTNLKIGRRLGVGFGLVLFLLFVSTLVGISRMAAMNEEVRQLTLDLFPKTVWANEVIDNVNLIARALRNLLAG